MNSIIFKGKGKPISDIKMIQIHACVIQILVLGIFGLGNQLFEGECKNVILFSIPLYSI